MHQILSIILQNIVLLLVELMWRFKDLRIQIYTNYQIQMINNNNLIKLLTYEILYIKKHTKPSASINQQICSLLRIRPAQTFSIFEQQLQTLNHFISEKMPQLSLDAWYQWITIILFNVSAMNESYIQQMKTLSMESINEEDKEVDAIVLKMLLDNSTEWLQYFLALPSIEKLLKKHKKSVHLKSFAETIDYIITKEKINCSYHAVVKGLLEENKEIPPAPIQEVNNFMFKINNVGEINKFLTSNYNADLMGLCRLIDANYYNLETQRQIFKNTEQSGRRVLEDIIANMIKCTHKKNLFGEKDYSRLLALFLVIVEHRYVKVYLDWLSILESLLTKENREDFYESAISILQSDIPKFLYSLSYQYPDFSSIFCFTYRELAEKEGKQTALEIMKKLILNRLFLNPSLFFTYSQKKVSQENFLLIINKIRILFYSKKVPAKMKNLNQIYENKLINFFSGSSKVISEHHNLYIMDRQLYEDYQNVHADLQSKTQNSNISQSYSLSFSFVKNSKDYSSKRTNEHKPPNQNQTLNQIVDEMKSPPRSPTMVSPKAKTVKTEHTQITDEQKTNRKMLTERDDTEMLWYLVDKRRKLGATRRTIDFRKEERKKRREQRSRLMTEAHYDFMDRKRQIERSANFVRIEVDLL